VADRTPPQDGGDDARAVLHAKYLDYCSAQVSDLLLQLTPDEMYTLAQDALKESGAEGELSYERIVQLATERVKGKLGLPTFDDWVQDYEANPERYDRELLGLWKADVQVSTDS
jgi:hypothetical protein